MSGRNHHRLPTAGGGGARGRDPPYMPPPPPHHHPSLHDDPRAEQPPFISRPPLHPAILEDHLFAQHQEIQGLLIDNQRLAATHVALKQELSAAQHELHRASHAAAVMRADDDLQLREVYERSVQLEMELRVAEAQRAELMQIRGDIKKLNASRQELSAQVQELGRATSDLHQGPATKAKIESMKQEVQQARAIIEHEKKVYAENFEWGQAMEKNLILMARELEKLRAEVPNAGKREHATAASGNPGVAYGGAYTNPDPGYGGNPYPVGYGVNPVQGVVADIGGLYKPGTWGAYDVRQAHGRR